MVFSSLSLVSLEHGAQNFAAYTSLTSCAIGHNTLAGRNNRDTETISNFRQIAFAFI
jgi:hypothetical protein